MFAIAGEFARYVLFMYLVTLLAYSMRDNNIYLLNQFIRQPFAGGGDGGNGEGGGGWDISRSTDVWPWLTSALVQEEGGMYVEYGQVCGCSFITIKVHDLSLNSWLSDLAMNLSLLFYR